MSSSPELYIAAGDLHYPKYSPKALAGFMDFLKANKPSGFVFGGDQLDNNEISRHTSGKYLYRPVGSYDKNTKGFDDEILKPIESVLPDDCTKVWIEGNHDNWENQVIEHQPEFKGTLERPILLGLKERGWKFIPVGKSFKHGKLKYIHGETLGTQHHSKRAVEQYCCNILYFHFHTCQSFTKILPQDHSQKWMAWCSPILGDRNPDYLGNRPTGWLPGFTVIEYWGNSGNFNLYPIVTINGVFSYGGRIYGE